jgi:energy-coupling factor transporter ATP-binding protein EcfA2
MKTQIVLLSGKQGAGKDTLAHELAKFSKHGKTSVAIVAFAFPIRTIHDWIRSFMGAMGLSAPAEVVVKDGDLMQLVGLWARKRYGDDCWLKAAKSRIEKIMGTASVEAPERLVIVVTDCRFQNEFDAFPEALRVRLDCARDIRKGRAEMWRDNEQHQSETDLDDYVMGGRFDMIFNTQTQAPGDIAEMVMATLERDDWIEKRHPIMK